MSGYVFYRQIVTRPVSHQYADTFNVIIIEEMKSGLRGRVSAGKASNDHDTGTFCELNDWWRWSHPLQREPARRSRQPGFFVVAARGEGSSTRIDAAHTLTSHINNRNYLIMCVPASTRSVHVENHNISRATGQ